MGQCLKPQANSDLVFILKEINSVPEPEPVKSSEKRTAALALPASIAIEAIAEAIMVFVCAFYYRKELVQILNKNSINLNITSISMHIEDLGKIMVSEEDSTSHQLFNF